MFKLLLFVLMPFTIFASDSWVYRGSSVAIDTYLELSINKGRVKVYRLRDGIQFKNIPQSLRVDLKSINLKEQLPLKTVIAMPKSLPKAKILQLIEKLTIDSYKQTLEWVTSFGKRSTPASRQGIIEKLNSYGYAAIEDYNIEAFKKGRVQPDKFVIIEAHMDTVRGTMGADDNGSGTAALLEIARILKNVPTKYSILFLVTEDEEKGLLGSKYKVKRLKEQNRLGDIIFVANMDMLSYRENDRFDIETEPPFKDLAYWVAGEAMKYTSLEPNILLHAWGADHVPFLDEGVPTVLTIEHWNNHNPCYHKACDNLDLVDWEYATELAKLNVALVALKAEVI